MTSVDHADRPLLDPLDPAFLDDPYPTYAKLRAHDPVAYLPDHDVWAVTRYDDVVRVVRDPATFSSRVGMSPDAADRPLLRGTGVGYRIGAPGVRVLIATDPPEHRVFRQAVAAAFAPAAIDSLQDRIEALARDRIEVLLRRNDAGVADFVTDVAEPLPVLVLAELLGVPEGMHEEFRLWARMITADLDESGAPASVGRGMDMFRYFRQQLRQPASGSRRNLFHDIARAAASGISERELLAFCAFLLVAGAETTANLLTNLLAALLRFPDVAGRLRADLGSLEPAVTEALRYDTSVQALWRGTTRAVDVAGRRLPEGARLLVLFGSANRDERKFRDPDRFVVDRAPSDHVSFGAGPHYCLGSRLARAELVAVTGALLAATSSVEPAGQAQRTRSVVLRGFTSQPVRLVPR
jgi:hypothetical protein